MLEKRTGGRTNNWNATHAHIVISGLLNNVLCTTPRSLVIAVHCTPVSTLHCRRVHIQ